ncbi:MAG: prepilin-type N-terminal cleavage/methylation domain-containing protein [Deltaproteobacteria bacterium]|nr:prepilin-type N-terminal cleavage/methylation domain-containing protein [Deltaproteobacteria bacterium]
MKDTRGFTLVEMLIGMVILSLAIAGALSFFILQSREGFESFKIKRIDESVALAQAVLARDIMEAGFGVTDCNNSADASNCRAYLAIRIVDGANEGRDALYVNYGSYLTLEPPTTHSTTAVQTAMKKTGVFYDTLCKTDDACYQGFIELGTGLSQFTLKDVAIAATNNGNVGALIATVSTSVLVKDVKVGQSSAAAGSLPGTQNWTFKLDGTITADYGAPAISYKWVKTSVSGEQIGGLWRNRGAESAPWGEPLLGGEAYFQVNDFQCDYQFSDGTWATAFSATHTPTQLKLVRVILSYQTRGRDMHKWGPVHRRIVTASPRNLVLLGD